MDTYDDDLLVQDDDPHAPSEQSGIVMSGSDLAKMLGVGGSSLSQSARSGWQCRGYDVSQWAVWEGDRIVNYDVPTDVVDRLTGPDAPDYPEPIPNPSPDAARRGASGTQDSGPFGPWGGQMLSAWGGQGGAYGTGFDPKAWPLVQRPEV